jgi:cardiolipin synthase
MATPVRAKNGAVKAGLVLRDNLRYRRSIEQVYLHFIQQAQREIIIANAYFLPGRRLRHALMEAAKRGVRVRLLLQGRVEYRLQSHATRWIYDQFLNAGVEILEYMPSHLHGKVAVMDNIATVGSSNLDPFSLLLAREANVVVQDVEFAQHLRHSLEHAIQRGSVVIDQAAHEKRSFLLRSMDALAYLLVRFGIAITGKGQDY